MAEKFLSLWGDAEPGTFTARVRDSVAYFIFDSEILASEVTCTLGTLLWVSLTAARRDLFESSRAYEDIAAVFDEWQVFALALGVSALPIVALIGHALQWPVARVVSIRRKGMSAMIFFYVTLAAAFTHAAGPGVKAGLHAIFALAALWAYLRLRRLIGP